MDVGFFHFCAGVAVSYTHLSSIPFAGTLRSDMFNVRTLVDLAGIASFVAVQSRVGELIAEREAANARMLFRSQYIQYKNYQESMDYIHMKYHDLKHQITGLRAETDAAERERWLDAMEKELDEHELVEPTGNQILDAVLGAKLLPVSYTHLDVYKRQADDVLYHCGRMDDVLLFPEHPGRIRGRHYR